MNIKTLAFTFLMDILLMPAVRKGEFEEDHFRKGEGHIVSEQSLNFIYTLLKATIQSFIVPFPTLTHFMRGGNKHPYSHFVQIRLGQIGMPQIVL